MMTVHGFFLLFDSLGALAFALSGALAAYRLGKDIYVILVMAGCTGMGGGLLRDIILQRPPIFLTEAHYLFILIAAWLLVIFAAPFLERPMSRNLLIYLDALGLGVFVVLGIQAGLDYGLNWHGSLFLGMLTAIAGGTMRDLMLGTAPVILTTQVYATPPFIAGIFYLILHFFEPKFLSIHDPAQKFLLYFLCSVTLSTALRVLSFHFNWHLPIPLQKHRQKQHNAELQKFQKETTH